MKSKEEEFNKDSFDAYLREKIPRYYLQDNRLPFIRQYDDISVNFFYGDLHS